MSELTVKKNPPNAGWRPGWYVYRGERCIVGPCDDRSEAERLALKLGGYNTFALPDDPGE